MTIFDFEKRKDPALGVARSFGRSRIFLTGMLFVEGIKTCRCAVSARTFLIIFLVID